MPVRSLGSSVLRWPDAAAVDSAVRGWAVQIARDRAGVVRIGYFGSYARGDWGVGSDVDIVIVLEGSEVPFIRRALAFDATTLPVPADVLVYTVAEWERLGFTRSLRHRTVWVYGG